MSEWRTYKVGDRVVIVHPDTKDPYYGMNATITEVMQHEVAEILKALLEGEEFEQALFFTTDDGTDLSGTNRYVLPEGSEVPPREPEAKGDPTIWYGIGDKVEIVSSRHKFMKGKTGTVVGIAEAEELIRAKLRGNVSEIQDATQALYIRLDEGTGHLLLDLLYAERYPVTNTDLRRIESAAA